MPRMTRKDFETNLTARLEDIRALYKEYNPEAFESPNEVYLTMTLIGDSIMANNHYYNKNETNPDYQNKVDTYKKVKE